MAKTGRPQIEINWIEFDKLCGLQCTIHEIAGWFNCSVDTIERRVLSEHGVGFADYFAQKRSGGKISLRRKQYEIAMSGNPTMLIWLGKQYLAQTDKSEVSIDEVTDRELVEAVRAIVESKKDLAE